MTPHSWKQPSAPLVTRENSNKNTNHERVKMIGSCRVQSALPVPPPLPLSYLSLCPGTLAAFWYGGGQKAGSPRVLLRVYQSCPLDRPSSQKAWAKCFLSKEAKIDIQACPAPAPAPVSPSAGVQQVCPPVACSPHLPCPAHPCRPAQQLLSLSHCAAVGWPDSPFLGGGWGVSLASAGRGASAGTGLCSVPSSWALDL